MATTTATPPSQKNARFITFFNLGLAIRIYAHTSVIYLFGLGFSLTQVSLTSSALLLSKLLFNVPTSYLADRWFGYRNSLVVSTVLIILSYTGLVLCQSFLQVLFCYGLLGVGETFASGAMDAFMRRITSSGKRYLELALRGRCVYGLGVGGSALIAWGIVVLFPETGPRWAYLAQAIVITPFLAVSWFMKEPARPERSGKLRSWQLLKQLHGYWPLILFAAIIYGSDYSSYFLRQPYYHALGLPIVWFALLPAGIYLGAAGLSLVFKGTVKSLCESRWLASLVVLTVLALLLPWLLPGYWGLLSSLPFIGIVVLLPLLLSNALTGQSEDLTATLVSTAATLGTLFGSAMDYYVLAWFAEHHSVQTAHLVAMVVYGGTSALLIRRVT